MKARKKKKGILTRIKRFFLYCSAGLFTLAALYAFLKLDAATNSMAGRVALKSSGMVAAPLFDGLPLWFWGLCGLGWMYLFLKHKLIVGLASGLMAGVVLAVII